MAIHSLDPTVFRTLFPAYADPTAYPDATLQAFWMLATAWLGSADGPLLEGDGLQASLNYMTAHILYLNGGLATGGGAPGPVTSSTIDKITVQFAPPPFKNGWQFWLSTSPYGLQLWALLSMLAGGGFYIGGSPERDAFRTAYGY